MPRCKGDIYDTPAKALEMSQKGLKYCRIWRNVVGGVQETDFQEQRGN